jgi:ABC-type transport system involved in multi-copper enzyme maturation permease subunit
MEGLWSNPVIARDMRVRLRGGRAFVNQGIYLVLLSLIAMMGYAMSTRDGQMGMMDPVAAQQSLRQFYYFIFTTLGGLVSVIAPALTAVAIVSERQRLTLDLLVTTPMTAMRMLTGKLLSSLAFLMLLLIMSLPLSSLCVILGGATISDVAQAYSFLITDGLVFAAIGLAFSCTAKNNSQAILFTYGAVALLVIVTGMTGSLVVSYGFSGRPASGLPLCSVLSVLCPFLVSIIPSTSVSVFGLNVPLWIASGILNVLLIRVILTGAALKIGMYGPTLIRSLRIQVLLLTALGGYIVSTLFTARPFMGGGFDSRWMFYIWFGMVCFLSLFMPALFGPHAPEDDPPGATFKEWYAPRRALSADYAGALPYFHMWLTCLMGGTLIGAAIVSAGSTGTLATSVSGLYMGSAAIPSSGRGFDQLCNIAPAAWFYLSALGFLAWSIARRAAWISTGSAPARAMTFLVFAFILLAPGLVLLTTNSVNDNPANESSLLVQLWLLAPLSIGNGSAFRYGGDSALLMRSGALAYFLGTIIYPFWLAITPGAGSRKAARTAKETG